MSAHSEAVRGIDFSADGARFVSNSYDKYVKLHDTETGAVISRHTSGKIPFCARLHPEAAFSNDILVGQQNKLVVQWDIRANEIVQTYNEHLGPVNSITFIDENRRFVSSSDDKKVSDRDGWHSGVQVDESSVLMLLLEYACVVCACVFVGVRVGVRHPRGDQAHC